MPRTDFTSRRRSAFTLVELLVSITIIVLLATTILYGMASVQTTANVQRTKAQIARLSELLADKWEEYEYRRVDALIPSGTPPFTAAQIRLQALREIMRVELPERITDIIFLNDAVLPDNEVLTLGQSVPGIARFYQSISANQIAAADAGTLPERWYLRHQQAECLYLIVSQMEIGDASALELFSEKEIGDVDQDGMRELLDGWGQPIRFLRWAAGFPSPLHPPDTSSQPGIQPPDANPSKPGFQLDETYVDPFDPLQVGLDPSRPGSSFYIFPLIMSAGPDELWGIGFTRNRGLAAATNVINYGDSVTNSALTSDPFDDLYGTNLGPLGDVSDVKAASDNIHNHEISTGLK